MQRRRYTDLESQWKTQKPSQKRFKSRRSSADDLSSGHSFVPLEREHAEDQKGEINRDTHMGHEFAGTNRASPAATDDDDESSPEEHSDGDGESPQQELQRRLIALDAKVRADACDIPSWLALASIQGEVVEMGVRQDRATALRDRAGSTPSKSDTNLRQSVASVQFAVLERASRAHPSNAASIPLMMARLDLAASSGTWDWSRMEREWKSGIESCSADWTASVQMWKAYLAWKMGDGDSFVTQDLLLVFASALEAFQEHYFLDETKEGREEKELASLNLVRLLVSVLMDAGFVERAHGIVQAISELAFRRPRTLLVSSKAEFRRACDQLEDYWDLEELRIGEAGSKGWSSFHEASNGSAENATNAGVGQSGEGNAFGVIAEGLGDADPVNRWLALERARSKLRTMPAKVTDQADWTTGELEVDPYSVVLYLDVRPFLVPVETSKGKSLLLGIFLASLGVPRSAAEGAGAHDHLIRLQRFWPMHLLQPSQGSSWAVIEGQIMQRPRESALSEPFKMPIKMWPPRMDAVFPVAADKAADWFALFEEAEVERAEAPMAKTFLEQAGDASATTALTRLGLSSAVQSHKATVRLAKQLLGQDRDNIGLWRAFARLERNHGMVDSARTVYSSVLAVEGDKAGQERTNVWAEWAELEWETGEHSNALRVLQLAARVDLGLADSKSLEGTKNGGPMSTMDVLRTRRLFEKHLAQSGTPSSLIFCAALFQYLSQDTDSAFDSAVQVFERSIAGQIDGGCREDISLTYAKFLWRHVSGNAKTRRSRVYLPRQISDVLSRHVVEFPHNSAFVALLAAFEMQTKVENVLRRVLEDKMKNLGDQATEQHWLTCIYCEMHMSQHSVNESAVRALFERAVQAKRFVASREAAARKATDSSPTSLLRLSHTAARLIPVSSGSSTCASRCWCAHARRRCLRGPGQRLPMAETRTTHCCREQSRQTADRAGRPCFEPRQSSIVPLAVCPSARVRGRRGNLHRLTPN